MTDEYKVHVLPQKEILLASPGQSLLEVLAEAGIFLRSDCGGKGTCNKCLVKILPDESQHLACRFKISGDLSIEIPESSLLIPEVTQKPSVPSISRFQKRIKALQKDYALAVDLGTTTLALYLCDLSQNKVAASLSLKNPQALFGDDVISRIAAVQNNKLNLKRLQKLVVKAIEWGLSSLLKSSQVTEELIKKMVVVGNAAMLHFFLGEDPRSLGVYPFRPAFLEEKILSSKALGFGLPLEVISLPIISGFLGSDILAGALATDMLKTEKGTMLIDIGTNGEIMLRGKDTIYATSCATGPAFEGAVLSHGMPAISGAIDAVKINPQSGRVSCSLIQHDPKRPKKASGICGSGVVSAAAELLRAGILKPDGQFNPEIQLPGLRRGEDDIMEFVLVSSEDSQNGKPITLTQKDIRAIQLGKGALRTGIELLCKKMEIDHPYRIVLAGAFGTYINFKDGRDIGMFPSLPDDAFSAVGNAAGSGAILTLFDPEFLHLAKEVIKSTRVLNLASQPEFQERFLANLNFPKKGE